MPRVLAAFAFILLAAAPVAAQTTAPAFALRAGASESLLTSGGYAPHLEGQFRFDVPDRPATFVLFGGFSFDAQTRRGEQTCPICRTFEEGGRYRYQLPSRFARYADIALGMRLELYPMQPYVGLSLGLVQHLTHHRATSEPGVVPDPYADLSGAYPDLPVRSWRHGFSAAEAGLHGRLPLGGPFLLNASLLRAVDVTTPSRRVSRHAVLIGLELRR